MRITVLDAATLGEDLSMACFEALGELTVYQSTAPDEVCDHIKGAEVLILNKVKLNRQNLADSDCLRLICISATGFEICIRGGLFRIVQQARASTAMGLRGLGAEACPPEERT